ncbi:hypothetical protein HMPREF0981_00647, partial [Erysipelotrichaceae bacterium 6_1_45]
KKYHKAKMKQEELKKGENAKLS